LGENACDRVKPSCGIALRTRADRPGPRAILTKGPAGAVDCRGFASGGRDTMRAEDLAQYQATLVDAMH